MKRLPLPLLFVLAACQPSTPDPRAETHTHKHGAQPGLPDDSAPGEDHPHQAPHGGLVATAGDKHIELLIQPNGHLDVFLLSEETRPISAASAQGKIKLLAGASLQEFALVPHGDHLTTEAVVPPPTADDTLIVLVDLSYQGKPYSARVAYRSVPRGEAAPHAHEARQGGQVAQAGRDHLELVLFAPGEYRLYPSDDAGAPLAPSLIAGAALTVAAPGQAPEVLPLVLEPGRAFWVAKGRPRSESPLPVTIEIELRGEAQTASYQVVAAVSPRGAVPGDHPHGAPHGGLVASASDKHLELLVTPDGHVDVFLLDADLKPLPATGAQGKVLLSWPGAAPRSLPLSVAAQDDHLTAMAGPLSGPRLLVEVSLTIEGRLYQARFDYALSS